MKTEDIISSLKEDAKVINERMSKLLEEIEHKTQKHEEDLIFLSGSLRQDRQLLKETESTINFFEINYLRAGIPRP